MRKDDRKAGNETRTERTIRRYWQGVNRAGSNEPTPLKRLLMAERYAEQAGLNQAVNQAVRQVTDSQGVPSWLRFWYASFGREVMKLLRTCPRGALDNELAAVRLKWTLRKLDPGIMTLVEQAVAAAVAETGEGGS